MGHTAPRSILALLRSLPFVVVAVEFEDSCGELSVDLGRIELGGDDGAVFLSPLDALEERGAGVNLHGHVFHGALEAALWNEADDEVFLDGGGIGNGEGFGEAVVGGAFADS